MTKTFGDGFSCYAEPTDHNALPEAAVPQMLELLQHVATFATPAYSRCAKELNKAILSARIDLQKPHAEGLINARLARRGRKNSVYLRLRAPDATAYLATYLTKLAHPEHLSQQRVASTVELAQMLLTLWEGTLQELAVVCLQLTKEQTE